MHATLYHLMLTDLTGDCITSSVHKTTVHPLLGYKIIRFTVISFFGKKNTIRQFTVVKDHGVHCTEPITHSRHRKQQANRTKPQQDTRWPD
jgi:hypothetical protein